MPPKLPDTALVRVFGPDLPLLLGGLTSTSIVLLADALTRGWVGWFSGYMYWGVIPGGALCLGAVAASGYALVAKWLQVMPSRTMLFNATAIGVLTWIALKWIDYRVATFNDTHSLISTSVSFLDYWQWQASHTQFVIGTPGTIAQEHDGIAIGTGTYALWEIVKFVGFLVGGALTYVSLKDLPTCASCRRYFSVHTLTKRAVNYETLGTVFDMAEVQLPDIVPMTNALLAQRGPFVGFDMKRRDCPACHSMFVALLLVHGRGNGTKRSELGVWGVLPEQMARIVAATTAVRVAAVAAEPRPWYRRRGATA